MFKESEQNNLYLRLENGHLVVETVFEGQESKLELSNVVCDGLWHNLVVNRNAVYFDGETISEVFLFDVNAVLKNPKTYLIFGKHDGNPSFEVIFMDHFVL